MKLPNLNQILIVSLVIITLLFLRQCNQTQSLKDEARISAQNALALTDSVRTITNKWGEEIHLKNVLVASEKELKDLNRELYEDVKKLEGKVKIAQSATAVIKTEPIYLINTVTKYPDGVNRLTWSFDTTYNENNSKLIKGYTQFKIDTIGNILDRGTVITNDEMRIKLMTGLTELDGSYQIFVKTDYPGIKFDNIEGAILDKKIFNKASTNESSWVFGPYIGAGFGFNPRTMTVGPNVSIGLGLTFNVNKQVKRLFGK